MAFLHAVTTKYCGKVSKPQQGCVTCCERTRAIYETLLFSTPSGGKRQRLCQQVDSVHLDRNVLSLIQMYSSFAVECIMTVMQLYHL